MKKVLILILLFTLPLISVAQNNTSVTKQESNSVLEVTTNNDSIKVEDNKTLSTAVKAQVIDLNYHKSNELISIKAYRKSLQIKDKTIKNC